MRSVLRPVRLGPAELSALSTPGGMFGLGPAYVFFLENRLPFGSMRKGWMPWGSTTSTNLGIAACAGLTIWAFGVQALLMTYVATALIAAAVGVWLFFVQHQFDQAHWVCDERWSASEAALGSSYYALPAPLSWFTANIGVHHVHHLCSRIPYYRLPEVLGDYPSLRELNRVNLLQSLSARVWRFGVAAATPGLVQQCRGANIRRPLEICASLKRLSWERQVAARAHSADRSRRRWHDLGSGSPGNQSTARRHGGNDLGLAIAGFADCWVD